MNSALVMSNKLDPRGYAPPTSQKLPMPLWSSSQVQIPPEDNGSDVTTDQFEPAI